MRKAKEEEEKNEERRKKRERLITSNVKQYIKRDVRKYFNQTLEPIRKNKDQLLCIIINRKIQYLFKVTKATYT